MTTRILKTTDFTPQHIYHCAALKFSAVLRFNIPTGAHIFFRLITPPPLPQYQLLKKNCYIILFKLTQKRYFVISLLEQNIGARRKYLAFI